MRAVGVVSIELLAAAVYSPSVEAANSKPLTPYQILNGVGARMASQIGERRNFLQNHGSTVTWTHASTGYSAEHISKPRDVCAHIGSTVDPNVFVPSITYDSNGVTIPSCGSLVTKSGLQVSNIEAAQQHRTATNSLGARLARSVHLPQGLQVGTGRYVVVDLKSATTGTAEADYGVPAGIASGQKYLSEIRINDSSGVVTATLATAKAA
jgi:hypothetical protein